MRVTSSYVTNVAQLVAHRWFTDQVVIAGQRMSVIVYGSDPSVVTLAQEFIIFYGAVSSKQELS